MTFFVGILGGRRIEFAVIIDAEFHFCPFDGCTGLIENPHLGRCGGGIVADEVNLGEIAGAQHHLLGALVVTEGSGMHQQRPGCGSVKPPQVQYGLGLAGAHKMPFAVGPRFDPRMVVIGMGPAGRIDLSSGNADGA